MHYPELYLHSHPGPNIYNNLTPAISSTQKPDSMIPSAPISNTQGQLSSPFPEWKMLNIEVLILSNVLCVFDWPRIGGSESTISLLNHNPDQSYMAFNFSYNIFFVKSDIFQQFECSASCLPSPN